MASLVACLLLVAGCSSAADEAARFAATASALFDAGNYVEAQKAIAKANAERDDVPDQYILQGRIELALGHTIAAFGAYKKALELDAANQEALQTVAQLGLQIGYIRDAERAADNSLALDPSAKAALFVKGLIALEDGHIPEALEFADRILEISPSEEGGLILKARGLAKNGQRAEARKLLQDHIPITGNTVNIAMTLLEIDRAEGTLPALLADFEAIVPRLPNNIELPIDFANTLYKSGDAVRARRILAGLLMKKGDDREIVQRVVSLWHEYDPTPLDQKMMGLIAAHGSNTLRTEVARFFLNSGQAAAAQSLLARPAAPASADLDALRARTLDALGQSRQARQMIDAILSSDTNNANALLLRSELWIRNKDARRAINDAQMVVRDNPDNEEAYAALAKAFVFSSQNWMARQAYESGIHALPQNLQIVSQFVEFLNKSGDNDRAMSVAKEFTVSNPASLRGWELLSEACKRAGDTVCADEAAKGRDRAATIFAIDERPGALRPLGAFGRL